MLTDRRLPVLVGVVLLALSMLGLYERSPMPAALSNPHADLPGMGTLNSCVQCHSDAGLDAGCLNCHSEIKQQLVQEHGFHHELVEGGERGCGDCHQEHHGSAFPLVNTISWGERVVTDFDHSYTEFKLHGSHDEVSCAECHIGRRHRAFHLPSFPTQIRSHSFLGLDQACGSCHEDPHAQGRAQECGQCHIQTEFGPEQSFDHSQHFALLGPHEGHECRQCHQFPAAGSVQRAHPFPFDGLQGDACQQCHDTPHRAQFEGRCDACHDAQEHEWSTATSAMTVAQHATTGFHLDHPHNELECAQCHEPLRPFDLRHPDPQGPAARHPDDCASCHRDEHRGQFDKGQRSCLDCHERHRFQPTIFGHEQHDAVYKLVGAHAATICTECHIIPNRGDAREFAGTPRNCRDCHTDPHAGQFAERIATRDCKSCHSKAIDNFQIPRFQHARRTGYELVGAHENLECSECHIEVEMQTPEGPMLAQRFERTPTACAGCHEDVHRGQFSARESCTDCHSSMDTWTEVAFDHDSQSDFPLTGAHREADCTACHTPAMIDEGRIFVRYRPIPHQCGDCHEVDR